MTLDCYLKHEVENLREGGEKSGPDSRGKFVQRPCDRREQGEIKQWRKIKGPVEGDETAHLGWGQSIEGLATLRIWSLS